MAKYNHEEIEAKWNKYWEDNGTFVTDVWDFSKPKYYCLDMFPYPSGEGLHVGHPKGYIATDVISRYKRMRGYNVLHPIGFDSFGLPAEQYAIKTGNHPDGFTQKNIETFKRQLKLCGLSFDWTKEISTCDPNFYKWTQWIFEQIYKDGLARYVDMPVLWCEELGTVLANDEVIDGKSERGGYPVVKKNMRQWVIDIPKYAEDLLSGLDNIDWPNSTKLMQKNWIGKSVGAEIIFKIADSDKTFTVFTTRPDTLYGATYCVLAPEHKMVMDIVTPEQREVVEEYVAECKNKTDQERVENTTDKTGVNTGAFAINPVNGKKIPIFIADYVLANYAYGALMAVPAHDQRDWDFAKKYNLDIIPIIEGVSVENEAYTGDGKHIDSGILNGLNNEEAKQRMIEWLEENKIGKGSTKYRLREWIFARQRYWGEPMPVIHMEDGSVRLVEEKDLPLVLPVMDDYKAKNGEPPLNNAQEWINVEIDGMKGKREATTMPGSAGSSWYFMRYLDPKNDEVFADKKLMDHWLPVDLYLGGAEHAVGHLLYSRMWHKFLHNKGYVEASEPFKKLIHQGMMLAEDGRKMSKRWGNVVNPDDVVKQYGADVFRAYEMFMGPIEDTMPWNQNNISGVAKFLDRIWVLYTESGKIKDEENKELEKIYHQTVKKVTNDYENLAYNTAISQMMIFMNAIAKQDVLPVEYAKGLLKLLNPIAPYITEELWQVVFGNTESIAYAEWPTYDEEKTKEDNITLPVQINGKMKYTIQAKVDATEEEIINQVRQEIEALSDKEFVKVIYKAGKILNIIIK